MKEVYGVHFVKVPLLEMRSEVKSRSKLFLIASSSQIHLKTRENEISSVEFFINTYAAYKVLLSEVRMYPLGL